MAQRVSTLLRKLERLKTRFGEDDAASKLELLRRLERRRLSRAVDVLSLHEVLCFLHAYPDDDAVLDQVRRMLDGFHRRSDLRRHADELADSGIAGTPTYYRFFWPMARWLVRHWPDELHIDWPEVDNGELLERILYLLVSYGETPAVETLALAPREWIERLKGGDETDAAFLVRRFAALPVDSFWRERLFEDLDLPFRLDAADGTPARTCARHEPAPLVHQTGPLRRGRPDLREALRRPPRAVRAVAPREGRRLIELAREAMVARSRDLDLFSWADPNGVRLIDFEDGLQFASISVVPERRLMLEALDGFLTFKNGVPIGYVLASALFRSSEIGYNVFETYRDSEAGWVFGRVLAMVRQLYGSDTFSIDPYQLGHDNAEGQASGAWWFYYKLGFRPYDSGVQRVLRAELRKMKSNPQHRSSAATLQRLSADYMFYTTGRARQDVLGRFPLSRVGERITAYLAKRFGADREGAQRVCSKEAARLLGVRSQRGWSAGERLWWKRWSPLLLILPGVARWPAEDRRRLVGVVRAKGGRYESDFVLQLNGHRRLQRALRALGG